MKERTPMQELSELALDVLAAIDDSKCYARCSHGGACGLEPGHDGDHDSDGHCQWPNDEETDR